MFDLYAEELTRYRAALAAWETRHAPPVEHEGDPGKKR
ncbi:hypothetical protein PCAR4_260074 [Paraburkholderia caribensis]|nr:hypothetical protein PCAR4_260074 [Paraburkholderia caribensis]